MSERSTDIPSAQDVTTPANHAPTGLALDAGSPTALTPSDMIHQDSASAVAILTRDIVVSHLAKADSEIKTAADLAALIETTYKTFVRLEQERTGRIGNVSQGSAKGVESEPEVEVFQRAASEARVAAPQQFSATTGVSETAAGFVDLPDIEALIAQKARQRSMAKAAQTAVRASVTDFDVDAWLAGFSNPSETMKAEAKSDNPNNKRGWIGVYDDRLICLLTGREIKILGAHLRGLFKNHPTHSTFATHAGYVQGLRLPEDYPKAAPYLSEMRKTTASKRGLPVSRRPDDLQKEIDEVLAKTGLDLSYRTKPATRPGNFPDFVVCLECGEVMHDIREHLREVHGTFFDRYKRKWKISGRAPSNGPEGLDFASTRKEAARLLTEMNIDPSGQIAPERWPGVLENQMRGLRDGALVTNLEEHLRSNGQPPLAHYLARYELPKNYPVMIPAHRLT